MAILPNSVTAAQANVLANMGMGQILNPHIPQTYQDPHPIQMTAWTMLYSANVEKVENGFILRVIHKQGDAPKIYVAHNADELKDLFIAAIVAERVSR